jgi:hypothetical protein
MAHAKSFREGWNHERFAQYILGKVSFISTPDTTGDDTGFDISGFFIKEHPTKRGQILPFLPYTLQVKPPSWKEPRYLEKHLHELAVIGVPYYIGVVQPKTRTIDIYSGKGLQALFSLHDWEDLTRMVANGTATVRNETADEHQGIPARRVGNDFTVVLYKVASLTMTTGYDSKETAQWIADCQDSLDTFYSAKAGEFIYYGPPDQYAQWIGVGTFTHAIRRFMHASSMLAEVVFSDIRFVASKSTADRDFLVQLRDIAKHVVSIKERLVNKALSNEVIDDDQWRTWVASVETIGNSAEISPNETNEQQEAAQQ